MSVWWPHQAYRGGPTWKTLNTRVAFCALLFQYLILPLNTYQRKEEITSYQIRSKHFRTYLCQELTIAPFSLELMH